MSFRVPGEELDFTLYGGANTNQLQLSPVQLSKLHKQPRVKDEQEGPDLTGYQSGIFDKHHGSQSSRERREKTRSSIAFVHQQPPSRISSQQRHQHHLNAPQSLATAQRPIPSVVLSPVTDHNDEVGGTLHGSPSSPSPHRHPLLHTPLSPLTTFPANGREGINDQGKRINNSNIKEEVIHDLEVEESLPIPTLRPSLARSSTIISTTSSSGRPRLTHRLSYLTHMEDLESEGKANEETTTTAVTMTTSDKTDSSSAHSKQSALSTSASPSAPPAATRVVTPEQGTASKVDSRPPPMPFRRPSAARQPPSSSFVEHATSNKAAPSPVAHPLSQAAIPPIPKLYKRLLRVFRPPSDSSDSDTGGGHGSTRRKGRTSSKNCHHRHHHHQQTPAPNSAVQARETFGLASSPENSSRGSPMSLASKKTPVEKPVIILPAQAPVLAQKPPPESTGFRARFLRKLMSSPNLTTVVRAPVVVVAPPVPITTRADALKKLNGSEKEAVRDEAPFSPLQSDFEHDQTCPAGQRIKDQKRGMPPRASTLPRAPPPMPTLQSKYGVPGRELGAGTQAQVMLLRVKSTKRLRNSYPLSHRNKNVVPPPSVQPPSRSITPTASPLTSGTIMIQDRPSPRLATPVDPSPLLTPRSRTGTLMTTTEDEVTPEQREAYRKRLLRRTSTGGVPMNQNGGLIYAIKKFRPPKASETHRQYLKKICAEFCISTSMDHENIIRTIDLVRDQPGHELLDDDDLDDRYSDARDPQRRASRASMWPAAKEDGNGRGGHVDTRDCSCPRAHRRARPLKSSNGIPGSVSRSNSGANTAHHRVGSLVGSSSHTPQLHRTIPRKSAISKPQRKRSIDSASNRGSDGTLTPQGTNGRAQGYFTQYNPSTSARAHVGTKPSAQAIAAAKKKKQQQEQETRQREVQRLKAQRQREKMQAKQQRLDQFPEYCMVMEFAAGGDLFSLLTKAHTSITLNEKHCLWRQLLNGVQYMHRMGVAHRDLKPENILIDASGRILKITDFGIANVFKSVGDPTPLPCKGIIGSEPYIAPEEFYLEEYDPRAVDVWACGIIFYVMFYSAMPWARADRKKDPRYARYITDINNHRYTEAQRRLQFDRRHLYGNNTHSTSSASGGGGRHESFNKPHEVSHHRQFPPYKPSDLHIPKHNGHIKVVVSSTATSSSNSGSPTSPWSQGETVTPHSSVEGSPVSASKPTTGHPMDWSSSVAPPASPAAAAVLTLPTVYNTYAYNGHLGGHEFIDRIEIPGCRRILYAIMEPDPRKRLTIDQVQADEWVTKIRFCSDEIEKPTLQQQRDHHRHFQPKPVRN